LVFLENDMGERVILWKVALAFVPTGIAGILLYPVIKPVFENHTVIAIALIAGGIVFLFMRPVESKADVSTISWKQSLWIGLVQILSFIPGVSRAGATLIGGTAAKIPRSVIVPFSFLLAIPTILGASAVSLMDTPSLGSNAWMLIAIGAATAFLTALATIKFFINLLVSKPLSWFGWYRIFIGIIVLIFFV
jgi:undecaprenyl-diphosphatase